MADLNVLLEAERRGILSPEKRAILSEARRRGLISQGGAPPIPEPDVSALPERKKGFAGTAEDLGLSLGQGATFNLGDELYAGLSSELAGIAGKDVDEESLLAERRARLEEIPASTAVPGELLGALATAAIGGPAAGATKLGQAAAKLPGWVKASGLGGIYGGLFGFGGAEGGLEERLESAGSGATVGGAAGAVGYPVVKGLSMAGGSILDALKRRYGAPAASAMAKVRQAMSRDEMSPQRLQQRLGALGPQATIADVGGKNIGGLARHTASVPGPAQNRATILLNQRAEGEATRLGKSIARGLDPEDYYAAQDAFLQNMRTKAGPRYQAAYQAHPSITSPSLVKILNGQTGKRAVTEAIRLNKMDLERGAQVIDLEKAVKSGEIPLEAWDDIKRGFDALVEKPLYQNAKTGGYTKAGRGVLKLKSEILSQLDEATGGPGGLYAQARKIYAGEAEALGALRDGRKIFSRDPEQITIAMGKLSEAGKEAYRSGAARAMKDIIAKTPDKGSAATRLAGNAQKRAQIRAVFPDNKSYRELQQALIAEKRFAQTRAKVDTGSMTEPRRAESEDALTLAGGVGGVVAGTQVGRILGGHTIMTAGMGRRVGTALMGKTKAHDLEVAKILFSRDPAANQRVLDVLMKTAVWKDLPQTVRSEIGRALLLSAAQQSTRVGEGAEATMDALLGEE